MKTLRNRLTGIGVVAVLLCWAPDATAYQYYSQGIDDVGNCAGCHGAFRSGTYQSAAEGISWGDTLHAVHLDSTNVTSSPGSCDSCHGGAGTSGRQVDLMRSGAARDGVNAIACMGCHGRLEDANDLGFFGEGWGAGLRQHHFTSSDSGAASACGGCHPDADPAQFTPASEDTLPPWYASVTHLASGLAMDPCNASGEEDFSGDGTGLDNDGDQDYDLSDADCATVVFVKGDADGDGIADILWRNPVTGQNAIWTMAGGNRADNLAVPSVGGTLWNIEGRGDYNGDGMADVLWRRSNPGQPDDGQIVIWLMQGGTRVAQQALPSVADANWQIAGSGDFDGDGEWDILWRNTDNGQNALWRISNGQLAANLRVPSAGNLDWTIAIVADYDGDGRADILWRNATSGQMALWRMNGATRLANEAVPTVANLAWQPQAGGDYNGDGMADIFWRNTADGFNAIWLMNGAMRTANLGVLRGSITEWQVVGDGDYNGDGMSDLLWRHATSRETSVWLMNMADRIGHTTFPAVTLGDWVPTGND